MVAFEAVLCGIWFVMYGRVLVFALLYCLLDLCCGGCSSGCLCVFLSMCLSVLCVLCLTMLVKCLRVTNLFTRLDEIILHMNSSAAYYLHYDDQES